MDKSEKSSLVEYGRTADITDNYRNRAHRQKYKMGYGAEGASRGVKELPASSAVSPKDESWGVKAKDENLAAKK